MSTPCPAKRESVVDQFQDCPRQVYRRSNSRIQYFLATALQMSNALLVEGSLEAVVDAQPVVDQGSRPVKSQQVLRDVAAAVTNVVACCEFGGESMQPFTHSSHAPSRFIRPNVRRSP